MKQQYRSLLLRCLLALAVVCLVGGVTGAVAQPGVTIRPGARLAFPNHGTVNAFVIFVQHPDLPDDAGDFGTDPITEWPFDRSLRPERRLPTWAEDDRLIAPPGTSPTAFDEGSISAFYEVMSHGRFSLTGYVYPQVYIPDQPIGWYHDNRGAFPNGAVKLAHEILTSNELQSYFDENPDGLDLSALDTMKNGTNAYVPGGDGIFDLIILVHRGIALPQLRRSETSQPLGGSSISSFGADVVFRPGHPEDYTDPSTNAFASAPVTLGGLRVIDNVTSGSGITINALTRKQAVRLIAHEIGHRHFGLYHTCDGPLSPTSDCLGLMGGAFLTMSAGDRIKLGWTEVVPIDVPTLGRLEVAFPDALTSGQVFRLRSSRDQCGDLIVEARFWSNFWDSPPNPSDPSAPFYLNDDGDSGDLFLPQEGLYLYKAPEAGNLFCGGSLNPAFESFPFSSLENNGLSERLVPFRPGAATDMLAFRLGGTYRVAYTPGDIYAPFSRPIFFFHENPALDAKLTLTHINREGDHFTAEIWTDHLVGLPEGERLHTEAFPNPFADYTTIRYEVPVEAWVTVTVYDTLGRRLALLAEGLHQPGIHQLDFFPESLRAGSYWLHVEADGRTITQPINFVR